MDVIREEARNEKAQAELLTAEVAVIGSMLIDSDCIGPVMLKVVPEHFIHAEYRHIFEAILKLWQLKNPVDPVTVVEEIGQQYSQAIMEIMTVTPTAANVMRYAELLQQQSQLHQIQTLAAGLTSAVSLDDAREISDKIYRLLSDRQDLHTTTMAQGLKAFFDYQQDPTPPRFLPWGFPALDDNLTAELGDYVILGATPSSGKTALALQFAANMAAKGYSVGFFSLETKDRKLIDRIVSQNSGISLNKIKRKRLQPQDWDAIVKRVVPAARLNLEIIHAGGMSVSDIQTITMSKHYDIVIIDYLQLIRSKGYNRTEEVTKISIDLHIMCQRLGVCVLGLSQLSRPDKLAGKREAKMSDLRESGQLEQDAEIVMILNSSEEQDRILDIVKNKDGDHADVNLIFDAEHVRFSQRPARDYDNDEDDEPPRRRHQGARSRR